MKVINIVFPHQLFENSELIKNGHETYLIEEYLFFRQYKFHKQKITFHRASMKAYKKYLQDLKIKVQYIASDDALSDIRKFHQEIEDKGIETIRLIDPVDDWLMQRIQSLSKYCEVKVFPSPQFLNNEEELDDFFRKDKKSFLQATFYKQQRKKHDILLDDEQNPEGGKWSFDAENRKKFPRGKTPPSITFPPKSKAWEEACKYTRKHFNKNPGDVSKDRIYPVNHKEAKDWLEQFLTYRFHNFGKYEDALLKESSFINHSLLSPLMNSGLILPSEVVKRDLSFAEEEGIPINSTEGCMFARVGIPVPATSGISKEKYHNPSMKEPLEFYPWTKPSKRYFRPGIAITLKGLWYWVTLCYCVNLILMKFIAGLWNCLLMRMTG